MVITPHLHSYDFPYHDYLVKNLNYFYDLFAKGIEEAKSKGGENVPFIYNPIWNFLNKKLLKIIKKNYYVSPYNTAHSLSVYIQDNKSNTSISHSHIEHNTITGVFYINPPKPEEGGGLKLHGTVYHNSYTLHPEPNKLYLFPAWTYHCPLPQKSPTPRVCLNWGYVSRLRPIHKDSSIMW